MLELFYPATPNIFESFLYSIQDGAICVLNLPISLMVCHRCSSIFDVVFSKEFLEELTIELPAIVSYNLDRRAKLRDDVPPHEHRLHSWAVMVARGSTSTDLVK